jgi:glycine betaine/proline transport system ATP-binding protein
MQKFSGPKISAQSVVKIFGKNPEKAYDYLDSPLTRQEVLEKTGCVIGVNQVDFDVKPGETFVVMGLSGSGKSTLIRCINRLIPATSGDILIDGENINKVGEERLRKLRQQKLAMVFQHFALLPHRTVRDNVAYGLAVSGMSREQRDALADKAIKEVGLDGWGDLKPSNLSGGMKQRVGIARALAMDSEVMLMDEPFSALDPLIRRDMQDMMLNLQHRLKKTMVFITHDLLEALKIGDRIAIMKEGRFVQIGTPEEIVSNPKDRYVADFVRDVDRARVMKAETLRQEQPPLRADNTAGDAQEVLKRMTTNGVFVTDRNGKPVGVVERRVLRDAAPETPLEALMKKDLEPVPASALLVDLFAFCRAERPIMLVDEDGRLAGSIYPFRLFERLAELERQEPEIAA